MAKREPNLDEIFKKTAREEQWGKPGPADITDLDEGLMRNTGVGLREGEIQALDRIGERFGGISRNKLIRFAVREFLIRFRNGEIDLRRYTETPETPKPTLRLPGEE